MKITKQILRTHAERLLEGLREEGISSLELALRADGSKFKIKEKLPHRIYISTSLSNQGTTALKISYISHDLEGVPIELVINPKLKYRQIIVKCVESVLDYAPFAKDDYDNWVQFRKSHGVEWADVIKDAEELTRLT